MQVLPPSQNVPEGSQSISLQAPINSTWPIGAAAEEIDNIEVSQTKDSEDNSGSGSEEESAVDSVIRRRNTFVKKATKQPKHHVGMEAGKTRSDCRGAAHSCEGIPEGNYCRQNMWQLQRHISHISKRSLRQNLRESLSPREKVKMEQGNFRAVNAVQLLQQDKKDKHDAEFDEGIVDIDLSSNEEDEEGEGEHSRRQMAMWSWEKTATKTGTSSKPKVAASTPAIFECRGSQSIPDPVIRERAGNLVAHL